jgi:O-antigen ligase
MRFSQGTFPTTTIINLLVFFVPAAAITIQHSIGVGTALLSLMGLFSLGFHKTVAPLDAMEKRLLIAFGIFSAIALFSIFCSGDRLSLFDTPSRFALAVPVYLLLRRFPPSQGAFWFGTAVGAIGGGLITIHRQFILGLPFDDIGYIHHIRFGDISLVLGGIAATGLPYFRRFRWGYLVPISALVFGIMGSILSGARGGWPAIPILLYCLYRQNFNAFRTVPTKIRGAILLMGLLAAVLFFHGGGLERANAAISDLKQYQLGQRATSVGLRFELWKVAGQTFISHPILGGGKTGFISTTQEMASLKIIDKTTEDHDHAHNDFLDTLAKRGLLGFVTLLIIFIVPLRQFIRTLQQGNEFQKPYGMAGLILTACFSVFCLTETMFLLTLPTTFYVFTVMVLCAFIFQYKAPNTL